MKGHWLIDGDDHWGILNAFRGSVLWEADDFQSFQFSLSIGLLHMMSLKGLWQVNSLFSSCKNLWYVPVSVCWLTMLTFSQIPLTNPYPGPWSVLILDNCYIHHAEEICKLVEDDTGMFTVQFTPHFNLWFTQVVSLFFCHPTCPITTQLNKPSHQSSHFSSIIGRILVLVLWTMHVRTSLLTRQLATFKPLDTRCEDCFRTMASWMWEQLEGPARMIVEHLPSQVCSLIVREEEVME